MNRHSNITARSQLRSNISPYAIKFLEHINSSPEIRERSSDRSEVEHIFNEWFPSNPPPWVDHGSDDESATSDTAPSKYLSLIMAILRQTKHLKSQRTGDVVLCTFALSSVPNSFPPAEERRTAREEIIRRQRELERNKNGVTVVWEDELEINSCVVPKGHQRELSFIVTDHSGSSAKDKNMKVTVSVSGANSRCFSLSKESSPESFQLSSAREHNVHIVFQSPGTGVFRALILFAFASSSSSSSSKRTKKNLSSFQIVRYVKVRSGDALMHDILKPTSPYQKRKYGLKINDTSKFEPAPPRYTTGSPAKLKNLPHFKIPPAIQVILDQNEMDGVLQNMVKKETSAYAGFWKRLLWASESQARKDIMLYDIENASLIRQGRFFTLAVPGLAEGRPSVLRGDTVIFQLNGQPNQGYFGRVETTRLEEVLLDFSPKFSRCYRQGIDTVNVRFTFSRTTFRTCHAGVCNANKAMGRRMLFPDPKDMNDDNAAHVARNEQTQQQLSIRWANRNLNPEQQKAVECILSSSRGSASALPYIIFGPPGTGKTTTVVEAVYQLVRHKNKQCKVLLVGPSNDAADILVEKLSSYFPPSEMRRILAYSRSLDQVSPLARPYAKEGLSFQEQVKEITSASVVVSTVNLAARFYYMGVKNNHFDVLFVDEAGHATEPEVIAVAASLFDFSAQKNKNKKGQMVLAGDPRQLGPIITSDLCKRFGMDVSYMERLSARPVYGRGPDGTYQPSLLTKLVRNYRSHPTILKLPNEMFYDNELKPCGDHFTTHSMARWEHLPKRGFPVIFHAVSGENLREANSPSWFNPQEAQEVVNYVDLLVNHSSPRVDAEDIGIITPYARQAQKIRLALKTRDLGDIIKVGSVETFQGQERRVIIISTVRAENDYIDHDKKYNLGFVSNKKRFNVAVTRAQALLIIVGQPQVLATDTETWLHLLRMCRDNQSWVGEEWIEGLDTSKDEDDLLASVPEENQEETGRDNEVNGVVDGMERLDISRAVEQEGLGYINREE